MGLAGDYPVIAPTRNDKLFTTDVDGNASTNTLISALDKILYKGAVGAYSNLRINNDGATPLSKLVINADFVTLWDTTDSLPYQAEPAVNTTADITASGVNGLDTGVEANFTWYFAYLIYNPTTDTVASLLSISATAPTMPSGYTFKKLVGSVFNGSGGDFVSFLQYGIRVTNNIGVAFLSSGASGAYAAVSPLVPTNATEIAMTEVIGVGPALISYSTDGVNENGQFEVNTVVTRAFRAIPLNTSRQFYYKRSTGAGTLDLILSGYTITI